MVGGAPGTSAVRTPPRRASFTREERGRSRLDRPLIDAQHLQCETNDDDRADDVHNGVHRTSLPSGWRAARCVLMGPRDSGRMWARLPDSCGVPAPGRVRAAPCTPVLEGVCKARSSPRAGWPDAREALLNRQVGCKAIRKVQRKTRRERPEISESLRAVGGGKRRSARTRESARPMPPRGARLVLYVGWWPGWLGGETSLARGSRTLFSMGITSRADGLPSLPPP